MLQLLDGVGPVRARRMLDALRPAPGDARSRRARDRRARARPAARASTAARDLRGARADARGRGAQPGASERLCRRARARGRAALPRRRDPRRRPRAARRGGAAAPRPARISSPSSCSTRRHRARRLAVPAAPRRGLPGAQHRPLGEGPGVGGGARDLCLRRQFPRRHERRRGGHRRGAPAVLRRAHARAATAARLRAGALLPPSRAGATTRTGWGRPRAS